jgi:hypothetical protein
VTARRAPLGDVRLPTTVQTEFALACLDGGERGRRALAAWLEAAGDPVAGLRDPALADRRLFALLHYTRRGDGEPAELFSILRAATVHEGLRAEAIGGAGAEAVAALAGIEVLVTGGAGLAFGRYPAAPLRHCHNVDLLVAAGELASARAALGGLECVDEADPVRLLHPSGTRISLHTHLHREPSRSSPSDLAAHAVAIDLAGTPARALGAADQLVQLCASVATPYDPGLRWLADGWFTCLAADLDWERVRRHAALARRTVPVSSLLEWLAANCGPGAPPEVRASLSRARRGELRRELIVRSPRRVRNRLGRAWRDVRA